MSRQATTLREIARQADVSVAAVSYVLNGKEGISEPRRRQIGALLKQAGLKPKHLRYPTFYICEHKSFADLASYSPFFQKYEGLNSSFHEAGVGLRVEFLNRPDARDLRSQLDALLSYKPGAVILDSDLGDDLPAVARFFEGQGVPALQIGHTVRAPGVDAVVIDDFGGAYAATRHLVEAGHTRIATIRWRVAEDPASAKKYAAFQCALQDAGLAERPEYVVQSPPGRRGDRLTGRVAVEQLLALPEPPTAVFVENSFVSASLLYPIDPSEPALPEAIRRLDMVHFEAWHLDVIEQVMAGVFNYPTRETKLLRVDWADLGRVAAKQIVERLRGAEASGQVIRLTPKLMTVKATTATDLI
ncbi:MAG: LacI family DNA-binding transcriptional regulator [Phycisphaeraceae bacterium]